MPVVIFHKRSYESLFCFLSDRAYLVLKSPPQFFVRCWHVWGHISPRSCADRMILLTSSSIPSCISRDLNWSTLAHFSVSVPLGNKTDQKLSSPFLILKNMHLWFRKRASWYMAWNTWELKLNSTVLTHSKSKLMLILSILTVNWWIWIIKLHLWYFVTLGVA